MIWQLKDDVTVDDVDALHVKKMNCSESHKYMYRRLSFCVLLWRTAYNML
jgi:hypothetical protein